MASDLVSLGTRTGSRGAIRDAALGAVSVVAILLTWEVGARAAGFVPTIPEVLAALPEFAADTETWIAIAATTLRVVGSILIALVLGLGAAVLVAREGFWGRVLERYVMLTLGIPSTIAALLTLFVFRRSEIGVYVVVVVVVFPFVTLTLAQGLRATDARLMEMGSIYRFGRWGRLRHVLLPHLVPYTFAAARNEYAHAWRVVVLAEVFAVGTGLGAEFTRAFDRFRLVEVLLWLVSLVVVLLSTEYLLLRPAEQRATRWRT